MGIYLEKTKKPIQKDTCIPTFTASSFIIVKTKKQPKNPSTDEWIEMWCVCIHMHTHTCRVECYSALKKKEILPFGTIWIYPKRIMLSEISQIKINTILFHFYLESKKQMNKPITVTASITQRTNRWLPEGKGVGK